MRTTILATIAAAIMIFAGANLQSASAAVTYTVDSTADDTTEDGSVTLREAILAANGAAPNADVTNGDATGDVITFDLPDDSMIVLTDELPDITDDLVIEGSGVAGLTVSGDVGDDNDSADNVRIFSIDTGGEAVSINNIALVEGNTANSPGDAGGAILVADGDDLSLTEVEFSANSAATNGGAIAAGDGLLSIDGGRFFANAALGSGADEGGGAIFVLGGTLDVDGVDFQMNQALGTSGSGGALLLSGGVATIVDSFFDDNATSRAGGAIEIRSTADSAGVTVTDSDFNENSAGSNPGNGGAIHITAPSGSDAATLDISGGAYNENLATAEGGAIWADVQSTVNIGGATIDGNVASGAAADQGGGGVFNNGGSVAITNSTISDNTADGTAGSGGGILNDGGTLTVTGGSIASNAAERAGGGIEATTANAVASDVSLDGVTIDGNAAGDAPGNGGGIHVTDAVGGSESTFDITDGSVTGNLANQEGGGIWNDAGGAMTITGTAISDNVASAANAAGDAQGGGGVFNNGGTLSITGAMITSNDATGSLETDDGGGGLFNDGRNNPGAVTITDTMITGNTATTGTGNGGGILNIGDGDTDATVDVTGGEISGNSAARAGGGIENNAGELTLAETTLDDNDAGVNGGGVHVSGAGTVSATDTTVSNNTAAQEGGGLWNAGTGASMTLVSSTVNGNEAVTGGGLFNSDEGTLTLRNATVSGNTATDGGGIATEGGTLTLNNATITENAATGDGGGILAVDDTTIDNTIVGGNTAGDGADISGPVEANFSLIGDTEGATITGADNVDGDPVLGALADNDGPTQTHEPQDGSPAVDAANAANPTGSSGTCETTDQQGNDRPIDGDGDGDEVCDMGAVEVGEGDVEPPPAETITYTLFFRWSLIAYTGESGVDILDAMTADDQELDEQILSIWRWNGEEQAWEGFFTEAAIEGTPGANDFDTFTANTAYYIAIEGPADITWDIPASD